MLIDKPKFWWVPYSIVNTVLSVKHQVIGQFSLFIFYWSPSIDKPRMTPVSFIKTTESYKVSLVTINRQTSYYSGILYQNYGIIRGLPMNHTRFADWVTIWLVHLPERAGLITTSDQTERAVHSCNSWFVLVVVWIPM